MTTLKIHNIESAPEASKGLLEGSPYGMIPGLHGVLAGAQGYLTRINNYMNYL
jgi:hypothetical protein